MKKKIVPFTCGALTSAIFMSTALASAGYIGKISFDTNSLYLNGHEIIVAGKSLTTELRKNKGNTVSITVTNCGSANIVFALGVKCNDNVITSPTKVPAGQTVTRTFRVLSEDNVDSVPYINIGNAADTFRENKFAVQVVQFDV